MTKGLFWHGPVPSRGNLWWCLCCGSPSLCTAALVLVTNQFTMSVFPFSSNTDSRCRGKSLPPPLRAAAAFCRRLPTPPTACLLFPDVKVDPPLPSEDALPGMSVSAIKALLASHGLSHVAENCVERSDLEGLVSDMLLRPSSALFVSRTKYDLVANICHDSPPGQGKEGQMDPLEGGSYRVHVRNRAADQWYEVQDLHVQESMPQLIGLSESYIMIYQRKAPPPPRKP
ncbi:unnamed protein product [Phaeothamnion confervicola]